MGIAMPEFRTSLLRLVRFLFWYGIAVGILFYLLPMAGRLLERHFEVLSGPAKLLSVLGVFAVIGVWQVVLLRGRR
jgi:hypothetical protein